jgi:phospholipid transport system substrate-binding protein
MTYGLPRRRLLGIAAVSVLAAGRAAWAQAGDPKAPIQALNNALLQIMQAGTKTPFETRAKLLDPAIQAAFDLQQILKISVGSRWSEFPPAQQAQLMDVFRRYTVASYVANFDSYGGQKFEVGPQTRAVGSDQVVTTRIISPTGDPTRIDYVMHPGAGGWKAVDVLVDGSISRVAVQRSDFRSLVSSGGASALIASLRNKTASLEAGGNT